MRSRWFGAVAAVCFSGFTSSASATLIDALDLTDLTRSADDIAVFRVLETQARWDDRGRIVTDAALRVDEVWKGDATIGSVMVVTRLGGDIGDLGMRVAGEPAYETGARIVVFLQEDAEGVSRAVGMSQGVLAVRTVNGVDVALPNGVGLELVRRVNGTLQPAPSAVPAPRALRSLRTDVAAILREAGDATN